MTENVKVIRNRPAVYLCRAAAAHVRAHVTHEAPERAAKELFGDDAVTDVVLRAATAPAAISGTSGWAASLAGVAIYDLVQTAASLSAAADVINRGLKLNMDGIAECHVPGRVLDAAAAGQWVAEGVAAPVRALSFANDAILRPRKLQVLTTYSRELAEHSNIEAVVRQALGEATASDPGDATKPPGLSRARRSRPRQAAVPMPCPATSATCSPRSRPTAAAKPL